MVDREESFYHKAGKIEREIVLGSYLEEGAVEYPRCYDGFCDPLDLLKVQEILEISMI